MKMKQVISLAALCAVTLSLAACAVPSTMLKNSKTGQVVTCGGGRSGSMAGGMIGYDIQKRDADKCVSRYKRQGFHTVD